MSLSARDGERFDADGVAVGQAIAAQLAVIVAPEREIDQLGVAMHNRIIIGQVRGVLMERVDITSDQAFDYLRPASSHTDRKLVDTASEIAGTRKLLDLGWASAGHLPAGLARRSAMLQCGGMRGRGVAVRPRRGGAESAMDAGAAHPAGHPHEDCRPPGTHHGSMTSTSRAGAAPDTDVAGGTVAGVMLREPTVLPATATVSEVWSVFASDHVHMVLLTGTGRLGGRLRGTIVRGDLDRAPAADRPGNGEEPALTYARVTGRTVRADQPAQQALGELLARRLRRAAVVDGAGRLVGLLCVKRSGDGFCSDAGVASRRRARLADGG